MLVGGRHNLIRRSVISAMTTTTKRCDEWPVIDSESALKDAVSSIPLWDLISEGTVFKLSRSFVAKDFVSALNFIARAGEVAEVRGHHPDLHLTGYRNVQVVVYTHRYFRQIILCVSIYKYSYYSLLVTSTAYQESPKTISNSRRHWM